MNSRIFTLFLFLFLFSLFSLVSCSKTRVITTPVADQPITIDGTLSDWDTENTIVETTDDLRTYAAHDDEFLYLFIDVRSVAKDYAIRQSGFIVYLSNSEDERKKTGIGFPAGTFNLLREHPGTYRSFTNDSEWMGNPQNQQLLSDLSEELFSRVMIVERIDGGGDPHHGFVELSQLEVDGLQISADEESRLLALEMKIPLDGSSVYGVRKQRIWLGFAIEPPNFRIQEDHSMTTYDRDMYGNRRPRHSASSQRRALSRNLGEYERWYVLEID